MKRRYRYKVILVLGLFAIISCIAISGVYYFMTVRSSRERETFSLELTSTVLLQQFEENIAQMNSVTGYILSDPDILRALRGLAQSSENGFDSTLYFSDDGRIVQSKLNSDYLLSNFYRVVLFNRQGMVIGSYADPLVNLNKDVGNLKWLDTVSSGNRLVILGRHPDDWAAKNGNQVYSLVRKLEGNHLGYIEVQREIGFIESMFRIDNENINVVLYNSKGELIYSVYDGYDNGKIISWLLQNGEGSFASVFPLTGKEVELACLYSDNMDVRIAIIDNINVTGEALKGLLPILMLIILIFSGISVLYVYSASRYVTEPVRKLQNFIETTSLDNIQDEMPGHLTNDEIDSLYQSYRDMMQRLKKLITTERHISLLQLQAQFDLLQAQINPHFIYNVLNVISNRGMLSDDEVICDICDHLAGILRYSTDTKVRYALVRDELAHLDMYFSLMKHRYEHKMIYVTDVPESLKDKSLPKIVLQQIAENSIVHGYENNGHIIRIEITGFEDTENWYIKVSDNGDGMTPEQIESINAKCMDIKHRLTDDRSNVEMKIGGMGIINTYARLYLMYGEGLIFRIESGTEGTTVTIGAYSSHKGDEEIVQDLGG